MDPPEEETRLRTLIRSGEASSNEISRYEKLSESRLRDLFAAGPGTFFDIQELADPLPPNATIAQSLACDSCGEMVMETKLADRDGRKVCRACEF